MKPANEKRSTQLHILVSEKEISLIKERMNLIGVSNLSAYLRKVAIDGFIINLDLAEVRELIRLLRICSNNLNHPAGTCPTAFSASGFPLFAYASGQDLGCCGENAIFAL